MTVSYEEVDCPKCNSISKLILTGKDYLHGIPGEYSVSECVQCGLWFQNPRPTTDSLAHLYPDDYVPHAEVASAQNDQPLSSGSRNYLQRRLGYSHLSAVHQT